MPLLRMGGEKTGRAAEQLSYTVPDEFAGSILDLEPDTQYEARLTMADPDGVTGQAVQTAKVRTRGEPKAAVGGRVLHVYPPTWRGTKEEPAFTGLMAAYYGSGGTGDWNVVWEKPAQPGDVILVHAGLYKGDRLNYVDPQGLTFHGTYILTLKGTPEKPIVIKSAGDGEAIFDGDGAYRLFDVMGSEYNIFDGLTIRNTDIAFDAGTKRRHGGQRAHGSKLPHRECRHRRQLPVRRLQGLLHRRQRDDRPRQPLSHQRLGQPRHLRRQPGEQLLCRAGLRPGPRDLLQLDRLFSRRRQRLHLRNSRRGRGPEGGRHRYLQQRHSPDGG